MSVIPLPDGGADIKFRDASFELDGADAVMEYTNGGQQVTSFTKRLWNATFDLPKLRGSKLREWRAALVELTELANTFEATPPDFTGVSTGYAGAAPLVAGAAQGGNTLNIDGAAPSTTIANRGDYFSTPVAGLPQLKMLTAPLITDSGGAATASFKPPLSASPADNAVLDFNAPKAAFRFVNPRARWSLDLMRNGVIGIAVREARPQ